MRLNQFTAVLMLALLSATGAFAAAKYPTTVLKNQFGEQSNNFIIGGSTINASFTVASADVGGNGITGLVGSSVSAVYMHTSQTPSAGNPNPPVGYVYVKFAKKYTGFLGGYEQVVSPLSGSSVSISSGLTLHNPYIITSVGTSTAANWQALGLPAGVTPVVGASFIATSASAGTGTGTVQAPATSGSTVDFLDFVGDPNFDAAGGYAIFRTMASTNSSTTTLIPANPVDGSIIYLNMSMY